MRSAAGDTHVAGVDEAGRGPLAGPVVAASLVLPDEWRESGLPEELDGLNDSKQLSEKKRDRYFEFLQSYSPIDFHIAIVDAPEIDEINILQATYVAMVRAVDGLAKKPDYVLIDGNRIPPKLSTPSEAIVKGDSRSLSIAAASILAKVHRDRLMVEYDKQFLGYGFAKHKGYGTKAHLAAIEELGPCPIHRMSFAPIRQTQLDLFSGNDSK